MTQDELDKLFIYELYTTDFNKDDLPILGYLIQQARIVGLDSVGLGKKEDVFKNAAITVCELDNQKIKIDATPNTKDKIDFYVRSSKYSNYINNIKGSENYTKYSDKINAPFTVESYNALGGKKCHEITNVFKAKLLDIPLDIHLTHDQFHNAVIALLDTENRFDNDLPLLVQFKEQLNPIMRALKSIEDDIKDLTNRNEMDAASLMITFEKNIRNELIIFLKNPFSEEQLEISSTNIAQHVKDAKNSDLKYQRGKLGYLETFLHIISLGLTKIYTTLSETSLFDTKSVKNIEGTGAAMIGFKKQYQAERPVEEQAEQEGLKPK